MEQSHLEETLNNSNEISQILLLKKYKCLGLLDDKFISDNIILQYLEDKENLIQVLAKLVSLNFLINLKLFENILNLIKDEKTFLNFIFHYNKLFEDNSEEYLILFVDRYYKLFKKIKHSKYNKKLHLRIIDGSIPESCLIKLSEINKLYLKNVTMNEKTQKEIIKFKPNLIKHIKHPSKEAIIFAIKKCFKLIYYVNNIDEEIYQEFIKSHNKKRIKKFYNWCKTIDYKLEGRFLNFDLRGFMREHEKCFDYQ